MTAPGKDKILYLDDDQFFIKIYKDKFSKKGCSIQTVSTVDEALKLLRSGFIPNVIMFDIQMGGKDGFVFLQELRNQQLARGAHIIALTNHSGEEDKKKAHELGATMYIVKADMIPKDVVQTVMDIIGKSKGKV